MQLKKLALLASLVLATQAHAAPSMTTAGVEVMVPATGEVRHVNEEVSASFEAKGRSKDKGEATVEVNRRMKEGLAILRARDPRATLQTAAFHFYPQYKKSKLSASNDDAGPQEVVGWEVSQRVTLITEDLAGLPKTSAAVQGTLDLVNLDFHLSAATTRQLDDQRTATAYQRLSERIASLATAMGKTMADATLESVSIDGAGQHNEYQRVYVTGSKLKREDLAEPVFEAGETTLTMNIVGKVRFK